MNVGRVPDPPYDHAMNPDVLASLRRRFIERCRAELRTLREIREIGNSRAHDTLIRTVHGLSGAGATFGFPDLSRQAGDLETLLLEGNSSEADRRCALDRLIATLESLDSAGAQAG